MTLGELFRKATEQEPLPSPGAIAPAPLKHRGATPGRRRILSWELPRALLRHVGSETDPSLRRPALPGHVPQPVATPPLRAHGRTLVALSHKRCLSSTWCSRLNAGTTSWRSGFPHWEVRLAAQPTGTRSGMVDR